MRFRPLSIPGRLRLGFGVFRVMRQKDFAQFEQETARRWIERNMGTEVWDKVWGPLLRGKFGNRANDISMAWLWARITVRRRLGGGESRQELLGYPRGSWQPLLDRLRDEIEARGGRVLIDQPASRLARAEPGRIELTSAQPDSWRSGHDPRRFTPRAESSRYDAGLGHRPERRLPRPHRWRPQRGDR